MTRLITRPWRLMCLLAVLGACDAEDTPSDGSVPRDGVCAMTGEGAPDLLRRLDCQAHFDALASEPLSAGIPGARSVKFVLDRADENALYFQNSRKYPIHWDFASAHLSGGGRPVVGELALFNQTEYSRPDRRFVLGSITHYAESGVWAMEIAPYDTADADMITLAFRAIRSRVFFGEQLRFHPTSEAVARVAEGLPEDVRTVSTDTIFAGTQYQPLNLGESIGRLVFTTADALETEYVGFRDIVVLDRVPNDISVVAGIITAEFQTPLSHINVLSQNRGTPNMALRNGFRNERLRALEGKWVRLRVSASEWTVDEVSGDVAQRWWEENRPSPVAVPRLDRSVGGVVDLTTALDTSMPLRDAIRSWIPSIGGKAAHYAALARVEEANAPRAFAVPVSHFVAFMRDNGFDSRLAELEADTAFRDDPAVRDRALRRLRNDMRSAPVDPAFVAELQDVLGRALPGLRLRFRSSTNAEDLEGFTGAGLYTSRSADLDDREELIDAVRTVWASVFRFRAWEERTYRGIPHGAVGMALLVHRSFPDEAANGVALTANIFDRSGLEPGFYINVQRGESSVVLPERGVTTESFVYQFDRPGRPITYLSRSSLVPEGQTVLSTDQVYELGVALSAVHRAFFAAYGPPPGTTRWYAMDVEFKFFAEGDGPPRVVIKQARPHPGRGQ